MTAVINFDQVTKVFPQKRGAHVALDGVSLEIQQGEIFGIIGYSGAGKSTLVRLINRLESATTGTVSVFGRPVRELSGRETRALRSRIGMIFQQFNLFESRSVSSNVEYPLILAGWDKKRRRERVAELLDFVGIAEKSRAYPSELSGGQKQRVGIARALATKPEILLADEATSALDPETTSDVLRLLERVNDELGVTIVVITHEMHVVRSIADRVAVMDAGKIVESGMVYDVFSSPKTETTRRFLSTVLTDIPSDDVLEVLKTRYPGRLFILPVRDNGETSGLLSAAAKQFGVAVAVVFGGITELQGRPFGTLTIEVTGKTADVEAFADHLNVVATVEEVVR